MKSCGKSTARHSLVPPRRHSQPKLKSEKDSAKRVGNEANATIEANAKTGNWIFVMFFIATL